MFCWEIEKEDRNGILEENKSFVDTYKVDRFVFKDV